ncbi:hypothetical protein EC991_000805 [Linnemannia zychae]|nr:hypothetical protein EC991_000805 [Linnemannia zychae]
MNQTSQAPDDNEIASTSKPSPKAAMTATMDQMSDVSGDSDIADTSRPSTRSPRRKRDTNGKDDRSMKKRSLSDMGEDMQERNASVKLRSMQSLSGLEQYYQSILDMNKDNSAHRDPEQELEMAFTEFKKEMKPRFKMARDEFICSVCGATTPNDKQHPTTYPSTYICEDCAEEQERQAFSPTHQQTATHNASNLIRIHEEQLKDLEREVRLNLFGSVSADNDEEEKTHSNQIADLTRGFAKSDRIQDHQNSSARGQRLIAGGMSWTIEENNLFFQGLRRFGKHNVWAIQEFIKTRSLAEVVTMVETMEMELARRRSLGLKMIRLSEMPMATEVDDQVVAIEEECASKLIDREMGAFWNQLAGSPVDSASEIVDKTQLFNMRVLSDLSSRFYIQNEGASMEREVVQSLYDALKEWLTPVVKELVVLQHERHRVTALLKKDDFSEAPSLTERDVFRTLHARQLPLDTDVFFSTANSRLQYMLIDDSAVIPKTIPGNRRYIPEALSSYGKQYYLNAETNLAEAEADDSDQGSDTDDSILAEEDEESDILEAPFPVLRTPLGVRNISSGIEHAARIYKEQEPSLQLWDSFWSTRVQEARSSSSDLTDGSSEKDLATQQTMTYDTWRNDLKRLEDTSFAIPKTDDGAGSLLEKNISAKEVQSMNKAERSHEQRLYLEPLPPNPPSSALETGKVERIIAHVSALDAECKIESERKNSEHPGYGPLPKNTSIMLDPTRGAPTTGYGLGKRDRGGLWQMDKYDAESGYITVAGSDDEEEEDLGYERQMKADASIDKTSQVLGWEDVFVARNDSGRKRRKRGSHSED